jgi:hypothetical protein
MKVFMEDDHMRRMVLVFDMRVWIHTIKMSSSGEHNNLPWHMNWLNWYQIFWRMNCEENVHGG